jgi:hypothetical protein
MIARFLEWPERRPRATILAIGVLFVVAYAAGLNVLRKPDGRIVVGDAVHYYVYLRSAVYDRDLHFRNDYVRLYGLRGGEEGTEWVYQPTATGHVRNMMSIGPPLVWAPLFILTVAMTTAFGRPTDGFERMLQASAGFSGILASVIGAWLTYRLARKVFSARVAIWSTIAVWLGSSAVYYSLVSPTYSHASSMLVVSAFFLVWASTLDRQTPGRYATVGLLAGVCALVRWQDAVFLIVPFVDAVTSRGTAPAFAEATADRSAVPAGLKPRPAQRAFINLAVCSLAALIAFSPQFFVWRALYGQWLAMPQGNDWMQWGRPQFGNVLLSDWHGLFTWTPIVAVAVAGLVPLYRRDRRIGLCVAAAFLVSLYANAVVLEWWAGSAYGSRRFVSCFPIFVLGFAAVVDRLASRLVPLVGVAFAFIITNGLLLLQYQVFMHGLKEIAPYPRGFHGLVLARFEVPFKLLAWLSSRA